jgi:hypothetical protein
MFKIGTVGALAGSMDIFLFFLPMVERVAERLVSFVFGSVDGDKCIDALRGP